MRQRRDRRLFYETIAEEFEGLDHPYDIRRRLEVVFAELLNARTLEGQKVLDAGCGYGAFSKQAVERGAWVVSCDIAQGLVQRASRTASALGVVGDACQLGFRDAAFGTVISSELVEHTERPLEAVRELARVLKPGGILVITTPNRAWQIVVRLANHLRLRPFHGLENFVRWSDLEAVCAASGLRVLRHVGFHPWPFQLGFSGVSRRVDRWLGQSFLAKLMINQAVLTEKVSPMHEPRDWPR